MIAVTLQALGCVCMAAGFAQPFGMANVFCLACGVLLWSLSVDNDDKFQF